MTLSSLTAHDASEILTSYGPFHGFTLHSLTTPVVLDCALCGQIQALVFVATRGNLITCPRCYAHTLASTQPHAPTQRYTAERSSTGSTAQLASSSQGASDDRPRAGEQPVRPLIV